MFLEPYGIKAQFLAVYGLFEGLVDDPEDAPQRTCALAQEILVDNTPPDPVVPDVSGGASWRRSNGFAVSWSNPPNGAAPIGR